MTTTRRSLLQGVAAAGALTALPQLASAQTAVPRANTLRCVMHADLASLDPIATTANIVQYHGGLVYDTLFGVDTEGVPKMQMLGAYTVSPDQLLHTMTLRPGLKFHDGAAVTAKDCVASIKRWGVRDGAGQHLFRQVVEIAPKDDNTFTVKLKQPYPMLDDWLGKFNPSVCWIMREKDALSDPTRPITEAIGSGPYMYNRTESRSGAQYVYDRNPNYVARTEPSSFMAGAKTARMQRIVFQNMPDEQTAISALINGEIDFIERTLPELRSQLANNPRVRTEVLNKTGDMGWVRLNHLHAPFNNVKARQAMLSLIDQNAMLKAMFGDLSNAGPCGSLFGCGTTMENDANTGWLKSGQNIAKAAALFKEAGYDGKPIVLLQQTTTQHFNNASLMLAQLLRQAGLNVNLVPSDWPGIVARRANKSAPADGGWNIFLTSGSGAAFSNPITLAGHAANGEKGWFGWPDDAKHEQLRDAWVNSPNLEARKKVARDMQENAWNFVPHVYLGRWNAVAAMRSDVKGLIGMPEMVPFWNVQRG